MEEIKELTDKILKTKDLDELTKLLCTREGAIWFDNFIGIYTHQGTSDSKHYAVYITPYPLRLEDSAEYSKRTSRAPIPNRPPEWRSADARYATWRRWQ